MLQPIPAPAAPPAERLRPGAGRRALALGLAILIEGLLLLLLLTFSAVRRPDVEEEEAVTVANLQAEEVAQEAPEPDSAEPAQQAAEPVPRPSATQPPSPQPPSTQPAQPSTAASPVPSAPALLPTPFALPTSPPPSPPAPRPAPRPAAPPGPAYGPPDTGGSASSRDTAVVGTAPNGEPLYAAAWHREPRSDELRAYLSTARGPGWGLIACRTAPNYRVEDCVALDEYPAGSQINRAILAAAWEFQVRPPRRGGRLLVGSWVRIRIDYRIQRR